MVHRTEGLSMRYVLHSHLPGLPPRDMPRCLWVVAVASFLLAGATHGGRRQRTLGQRGPVRRAPFAVAHAARGDREYMEDEHAVRMLN